MKGYVTIEEGCVDAPNAKPIVSVIVPIYNTEKFLDHALDSIESQTLKRLEIICVNDGSTDSSPDIIAKHAAQDERIRVINKPNGGYGSACNRGLREARGTWVAIMEPDDWIDASMYQDMVNYAERFSSQVDIVKTPYHSVLFPDTPDQTIVNCDFHHDIKPRMQPFTVGDKGFVRILRDHPSIWSAIYRKSFLEENDITFHEIPGAGWADNPFFIETLCQAKAIVYLPKPYYYYRENTPEQEEAFAVNHTMLPVERWHDMTDWMDAHDIDDRGVRRVHNERGFFYLSGIVEVFDLSNDEIREAALSMFNRMDDDLVFNDPLITPGWKRTYAKLKGINLPPISQAAYAKSLVQKGVHNVRNNGPKEAARVVTNFFKRRKSRSGETD